MQRNGWPCAESAFIKRRENGERQSENSDHEPEVGGSVKEYELQLKAGVTRCEGEC